MNSKDLLTELRRRMEEPNNKQLAENLGISYALIQQWSSDPRELTPRQVSNLVESAKRRGAKEAHYNPIRPIVEYYPIDLAESKQGVKWEIFDSEQSGNKRQESIKETLKESYGVYVFYDSRGFALYVGKAKTQSLWAEMKSAFNRDRPTQKIRCVVHPSTGTGFQPAYETPRKIEWQHVQLSAMALYFSAYEVDSEMIDNVEAMLVRVFANGLLNARMENFSQKSL